MSARNNNNKVLTDILQNVIDCIDIFKIIESIDIAFLVLNIKLTNLTIFLLS